MSGVRSASWTVGRESDQDCRGTGGRDCEDNYVRLISGSRVVRVLSVPSALTPRDLCYTSASCRNLAEAFREGSSGLH